MEYLRIYKELQLPRSIQKTQKTRKQSQGYNFGNIYYIFLWDSWATPFYAVRLTLCLLMSIWFFVLSVKYSGLPEGPRETNWFLSLLRLLCFSSFFSCYFELYTIGTFSLIEFFSYFFKSKRDLWWTIWMYVLNSLLWCYCAQGRGGLCSSKLNPHLILHLSCSILESQLWK